MAEKNTLSILETIKKKMLKLDQKTDKVSAISNAGDEFQYISSGKEKAAPPVVEVKAPEKPMPKFEDSLGLDVAEPAPIKQPEKAPEKQAEKAPAKVGGMGSFDDFNLDDLDLDSEEKSFAAPANPQAAPERVATEKDPNFEEEEAENFEDEVDLEEKAEVKEEAVAEVTASEGTDWLGNKVEGEEGDELNLEVDAKIEEKSPAAENHELDLDHIADEPEVDELDLEHLEKDEGDLDLDHLEEKSEEKVEAAPANQKPQEVAATEIKNDDLDLEHLEEEEFEEEEADLEEIEPEEKAVEVKVEATPPSEVVATEIKNDDLDLEHLEEEEFEEEETEEEKLEEIKPEEKAAEVKVESAPASQKPQEVAATEIKNDDLDLEHLEEEEPEEELKTEPFNEPVAKVAEIVKEAPKLEQPQVQQQAQPKAEEGLSFDDFEFDEEENEAPKVQPELPSFGKESAAPMVTVQELKVPVVQQQVQSPTPQPQVQQLFSEQKPEVVKVAPEPVVEKHEIDLEFEKEIMGFKSGATRQNTPQPINQEMSQPVSNQAPAQNNVSAVSQQNSEMQIAGARPIDSTIRQVNDSVKRLLDAKNVVSGISSFSQSPALAELALHLMEPKIEKWFNDNLPELVEKVVREEIRKMIPKE